MKSIFAGVATYSGVNQLIGRRGSLKDKTNRVCSNRCVIGDNETPVLTSPSVLQ